MSELINKVIHKSVFQIIMRCQEGTQDWGTILGLVFIDNSIVIMFTIRDIS